jgi:hypothetical protein
MYWLKMHGCARCALCASLVTAIRMRPHLQSTPWPAPRCTAAEAAEGALCVLMCLDDMNGAFRRSGGGKRWRSRLVVELCVELAGAPQTTSLPCRSSPERRFLATARVDAPQFCVRATILQRTWQALEQ